MTFQAMSCLNSSIFELSVSKYRCQLKCTTASWNVQNFQLTLIFIYSIQCIKIFSLRCNKYRFNESEQRHTSDMCAHVISYCIFAIKPNQIDFPMKCGPHSALTIESDHFCWSYRVNVSVSFEKSLCI